MAAEVTEAIERVGLTSRVRVLAATDALVREEGAIDNFGGSAELRSERSGDVERGLVVRRLAIPGLVRSGLTAALDAKPSSPFSGLLGRVARRGNTIPLDVDAVSGGTGRIG